MPTKSSTPRTATVTSDGHVKRRGIWQINRIAALVDATHCIECGKSLAVGETVTRGGIAGNPGWACDHCKPHHLHRSDPETCIYCRVPKEGSIDYRRAPDAPLVATAPETLTNTPTMTPQIAAKFFGVTVAELQEIIGPVMMRGLVHRWDLWRLIVAGAESRYGTLSAVEERIGNARRMRARVPLSALLKQAVQARDAGLCRYCGVRVTRGMITFDHVVPLCQNGEHSIANVVLACRPCNTKKGQKLPWQVGMMLLPPLTPRANVPVGKARKEVLKSQEHADWPLLVSGPGVADWHRIESHS